MSNAAANECKDSLIGRSYPLACEFREGIERCDRGRFRLLISALELSYVIVVITRHPYICPIKS